MKTTPANALSLLTGIPPIEVVAEENVKTATRLCTLNYTGNSQNSQAETVLGL